VFRGRKLVLNYTDGSPCGDSYDRRDLLNHDAEDIDGSAFDSYHGYRKSDEDDEEDDKKDKDKGKSKSSTKRKQTIISFLCENDPLAAKATVSFVGASEDECTYIFEARSSAACGGIEKEVQQLGPGGVFGVM
jgi:cation-dependent mannose-6-phosphate receptor